MNDADKSPRTLPQDDVGNQRDQKQDDRKLEKGVEDTFPASDPPAETQPGSGITETEVIDESKIRRDL